MLVVDDVGELDRVSADYTVSRQGTLVHVKVGAADSPRSLVWVDRSGRETPIDAPLHIYSTPRLSPDGTRIAVTIREQQNDIHVFDLKRGTLMRLASSSSVEFVPDLDARWPAHRVCVGAERRPQSVRTGGRRDRHGGTPDHWSGCTDFQGGLRQTGAVSSGRKSRPRQPEMSCGFHSRPRPASPQRVPHPAPVRRSNGSCIPRASIISPRSRPTDATSRTNRMNQVGIRCTCGRSRA